MRSIVLLCLFAVAATAAVLPQGSYLPSEEKASSQYLPPAEKVAEVMEDAEVPQESAVLADDGYQYKTVRRLRYRQRRDVSEISKAYLPPTEEPSNEYLPPAELKEAVEATEAPEESAVLAEDGYRYKTVRRLKYRTRRDVPEVVAPKYLPSTEEVAKVKEAEVPEAPKESAALADDGYRYKTVRRLKYRTRRDVSEVVAPKYLPPTEEVAEVKEAKVTEAPKESAALAEDGYRYKTVRRFKYRTRRDVPEAVAPKYLPPTEELAKVKAAEVTEAPKESASLAEDGYRYKTVRRLRYRTRRDVPEVVAPKYLPPTEEVAKVKAAEVTEAPKESAALAEDGYRYKTVRRLKYRIRRDVPEVVAPKYLPPTEEVAKVKEAEVTEAPKESAALAEDGYRYKTVRRLKYRIRRDVPEVVAPKYLPPTEEVAKVKEAEVTEAPKESAALAEDGYRYKTVRRLKYRIRRDVPEVVAPKYLPPVKEAANEYLPPTEKVADAAEEPIEESSVLADDGYRYKTVKRIRYRN